MGMTPAKIDSVLRALRGFGPYGVFLAFGLLGLSIFYIGGLAVSANGKLEPEGKAMRWIGVGFCLMSLVFLGLWHVFGWPSSLLKALATPTEPTPKQVRRR
jgi:hypothetical protein